MPFASKSQQRYLFATNPKKAKEWARETDDIKSLPEKKHPNVNPKKKDLPPMKTASDSLFFENLPGRENGDFNKEAFTSYAQGKIPKGGGINVSPTGGMGGVSYGAGDGKAVTTSTTTETSKSTSSPTEPPSGGSSFQGEGMGGGMYGSGDGKSDATKNRESDEERLNRMLSKAGPGKERSVGSEKTAARLPSDWDADTGLPTGFHRPSDEQPEPLESGGERFHSTEAKAADFGAGKGISHGLRESGSFSMKATSSPQMGKHASTPRFLGTSYSMSKEAQSSQFWTERGREFKGSVGKGLKSIGEGAQKATEAAGEAASEGVKQVTGSPAASLAALIGAGLLGAKGAKGLGRLGKKGLKRFGKKPIHAPPPKPKSFGQKIREGAKSALGF